MSTRPPSTGIGPLDHLSLRYLRQALAIPHPVDEPYVLNEVERRVIRRAKVVTLTIVVLLSVLGVLFFYWPQYSWPYLFEPTTADAFGYTFTIPLVTYLYGLLLIYVEVNLLLLFNQWGVQMIMDVCDFPRAHDAQYSQHIRSMADTAAKKSPGGFFHFSLDPYLMLPRWGLPLFFLLNLVKAFLSTLALKAVLKVFSGKLTLDPIVNVVGVPVYALWNFWASWQVLHEAQIRVMAPATIREFLSELYEEWGQNDQHRHLLLDALQFTGVLDRQHNYAHYLLTENLLNRFDLSTHTPTTNNFTKQVLQMPPNVRRSVERLVVFGVLIDGQLSLFEKRRLHSLRQHGILTYSAKEIRKISADFNQGKGLWV